LKHSVATLPIKFGIKSALFTIFLLSSSSFLKS
jgi:hypothetical protein